MILIADSGSTKTEWRLILPDGKQLTYHSVGINPYFHTADSVAAELRKINFDPYRPDQVENIHFYGAGSSTPEFVALMEQGFGQVFTGAEISIYHDLLGAARALFGRKPGVAGILGTGSNSCYYNGQEITRVKGGYGYILGDEGSGQDMGKHLVMAYLNDDLPPDLDQKFKQKYGLTPKEVEFEVYKKPFPNRFLASFSHFIGENESHPFCAQLARERLARFFDLYITRHPEIQGGVVGLIGSIAYRFRPILERLALERNIRVGQVLRSPVDGMVQYHLKSHDLSKS